MEIVTRDAMAIVEPSLRYKSGGVEMVLQPTHPDINVGNLAWMLEVGALGSVATLADSSQQDSFGMEVLSLQTLEGLLTKCLQLGLARYRGHIRLVGGGGGDVGGRRRHARNRGYQAENTSSTWNRVSISGNEDPTYYQIVASRARASYRLGASELIIGSCKIPSKVISEQTT